MMTDRQIAAVIAEWVLQGRHIDMDTVKRGLHVCAFSSVSDPMDGRDWLVVDRDGVRPVKLGGGWISPAVACITSGKEHVLIRSLSFQHSKIAQKWLRKTLDALAD